MMVRSASVKLIEACQLGDASLLAKLIRWQEDDLNQADEEGETALHWAAAGNHSQMVEMLADAGADVSLPNAFGDTPVARAVAENNPGRCRCEAWSRCHPAAPLRFSLDVARALHRLRFHGAVEPLKLADTAGSPPGVLLLSGRCCHRHCPGHCHVLLQTVCVRCFAAKPTSPRSTRTVKARSSSPLSRRCLPWRRCCWSMEGATWTNPTEMGRPPCTLLLIAR